MRDTPINAMDIPGYAGKTVYPEPFARRVAGRVKRKLGDVFGLQNFGVNLTELEPGSISALLHSHAAQDEFVFILEGTPIVVIGDTEHVLGPGDCVGFRAGSGIAHQLINRSSSPVRYLEMGDRLPGDSVTYPDDDIAANLADDGAWIITHKDGTPY